MASALSGGIWQCEAQYRRLANRWLGINSHPRDSGGIAILKAAISAIMASAAKSAISANPGERNGGENIGIRPKNQWRQYDGVKWLAALAIGKIATKKMPRRKPSAMAAAEEKK
jgi:hypothetical protein